MIDLLSKTTHASHRIRLTVAFRKGIFTGGKHFSLRGTDVASSTRMSGLPIQPWNFSPTQATQPLAPISRVNGSLVRSRITVFPSPDPSLSRNFPGVQNCFADCLFRLQVTKFHRL